MSSKLLTQNYFESTGLSKEEAMDTYVKVVEKLKGKYGIST